MNKVGEINKSNQGYMMTIIKYYDYHNIEIMFNDERNTVVHADYSAFQIRSIKRNLIQFLMIIKKIIIR